MFKMALQASWVDYSFAAFHIFDSHLWKCIRWCKLVNFQSFLVGILNDLCSGRLVWDACLNSRIKLIYLRPESLLNQFEIYVRLRCPWPILLLVIIRLAFRLNLLTLLFLEESQGWVARILLLLFSLVFIIGTNDKFLLHVALRPVWRFSWHGWLLEAISGVLGVHGTLCGFLLYRLIFIDLLEVLLLDQI